MTGRSGQLLVDVAPLSCGCTDFALDVMYKALADPPDADGIWSPHPDPMVRATIEKASDRLSAIIGSLYQALIERVRASGTLRKAEWPLRGAALAAAIDTLQGKDPRTYTVTDWMVLVDWLVEHFLPLGVINTEAEYLVVRGAVAGRIQAWSEANPVELPPGRDLGFPSTFQALRADLDLPALQWHVLDIARARAAENIQNIGEQTRHRIKHLVTEHLKQNAIGEKAATPQALESKLFDEFSILNRDFRRIAITEVGNAQLEGLIASLEPGTIVRRYEAYTGACPFCERINGMELEVVSALREDKDGWKHVWPGKSNVGRSASPRKRVGDELVERTPAEMWWPAAGLQHPNCRGGWRVVRRPTDDPKLKALVHDLMVKHGLINPDGTPHFAHLERQPR